MANTTNIKHTCGECTFYNNGYCTKNRLQYPRYQYACERFMTDEEYKAERERVNNEQMERNETRLNFLLPQPRHSTLWNTSIAYSKTTWWNATGDRRGRRLPTISGSARNE